MSVQGPASQISLPITVSVIPASELEREQLAKWAGYQESDRALSSPFFRPEFTQAVAHARRDAYVAIIESSGEINGFFPFHRGCLPIGAPIGADRSNYHGVIAAPGTAWDARDLIKKCGLRIWDFHHLIVTQMPFAAFHTSVDESPYLDLSNGFDTYVRSRDADGSRVVRRLHQQVRRIEREIGPLRFEPNAASRSVLHTMMRWKSMQYRATNSEDRFAIRWCVELLERIHASQSDAFQGMLPALYAGDKLAAVAMCMRSYDVFHYWFPAYNHDLATYSPGMLLLLRLAEEAEPLGVKLIDLGKGRTAYKDRLASGTIPVAEGSVIVPSIVGSLRVARTATEQSIRKSRLRGPARRTVQSLRSLSARPRSK